MTGPAKATVRGALVGARLGVRAAVADIVGWARGMPGHRFGLFGRAVGARLVSAGEARRGASLLLTPVNSVRYWEFDFADRHLPRSGEVGLDLSSPRLLSLYLAHRARFERITVLNPDSDDIMETRRIADVCGLGRLATHAGDAAGLDGDVTRYTAAWSISVIEHIDGPSGDTLAVTAMFNALRPGGILVLTVPVDREFRIENRGADVYRLGRAAAEDGSYFFQRWYDAPAIESRIIAALGVRPTVVEWFGERRPGTFHAYEQDWLRRGHGATVADPFFIATEFRRYDRWEDMPGMGICGLVFEAPPEPGNIATEGDRADG